MADKIKCIVNGRELKLTEKAFKMAQRFFDAVNVDDPKFAKPIELQKPLIKPVMLKPIKEEVKTPVPEATKEEIKEPVNEEVKVSTGDPVTEDAKVIVKKRTSVKKTRNERTDK